MSTSREFTLSFTIATAASDTVAVGTMEVYSVPVDLPQIPMTPDAGPQWAIEIESIKYNHVQPAASFGGGAAAALYVFGVMDMSQSQFLSNIQPCIDAYNNSGAAETEVTDFYFSFDSNFNNSDLIDVQVLDTSGDFAVPTITLDPFTVTVPELDCNGDFSFTENGTIYQFPPIPLYTYGGGGTADFLTLTIPEHTLNFPAITGHFNSAANYEPQQPIVVDLSDQAGNNRGEGWKTISLSITFYSGIGNGSPNIAVAEGNYSGCEVTLYCKYTKISKDELIAMAVNQARGN